MKPRTLRFAAAALAIALPALASAHPGHGLDPSGTSLLHWLAEPVHALPLLAAAAFGALCWGLAGLSRSRG
jgi:hypothetical protein